MWPPSAARASRRSPLRAALRDRPRSPAAAQRPRLGSFAGVAVNLLADDPFGCLVQVLIECLFELQVSGQSVRSANDLGALTTTVVYRCPL